MSSKIWSVGTIYRANLQHFLAKTLEDHLIPRKVPVNLFNKILEVLKGVVLNKSLCVSERESASV